MRWHAIWITSGKDRGVKMTKLAKFKNTKLALGILMASYWVACSPKSFTKDSEINKCQNFAETCVASQGKDWFDYSATANGGLVDILFVDDNSGSMSFEQAQMANRFSSFISNLDNRHIDYRIGVITTDVSTAATQSLYPDNSNFWTKGNEARAINQNGSLQDGNLVKFVNGASYMTSSDSNREALFANTIKRSETTQCENFLRQYPNSQPSSQGLVENCPSGDERGIFAANLFFDKNPSSFVRPKAHLAVVFLADEDERSQLYLQDAGYGLSEYDQPQTLLSKVNSTYAGKTASFHAIITKDANCLASQSNQLGPNGTYGISYNSVLGSYGYKYNDAVRLTSGVSGDICANDYGSQLSNISSNIVDRISDIGLACENPGDLSVVLAPPLTSISWTVSGRNLHFSQALPPGTQVRLKYSCATL